MIYEVSLSWVNWYGWTSESNFTANTRLDIVLMVYHWLIWFCVSPYVCISMCAGTCAICLYFHLSIFPFSTTSLGTKGDSSDFPKGLVGYVVHWAGSVHVLNTSWRSGTGSLLITFPNHPNWLLPPKMSLLLPDAQTAHPVPEEQSGHPANAFTRLYQQSYYHSC